LLTRRIRVVFTSSRDAGSRVRSLENYFYSIFSDSAKLNRGRASLESILTTAQRLNSDFLCIIESRNGNPSTIKLFSLSTFQLKYAFEIRGLSLYSDKGIPYKFQFSRPYLNYVETACEQVKWFLIDLGAIINERGKIKVNIKQEEKNCRVIFSSEQEIILSLLLHNILEQ
jgi:hypothetical protein